MKVLITGICGFVGCVLVEFFRRQRQGMSIAGIDNLSRRGSELNIPKLKELDVNFFYGDLREVQDLDILPAVDWVIDCAANPSVLAGTGDEGSPAQLVGHNLRSTLNLLEFCRKHGAGLIMLSTSRVYSISQLNALPLCVSGNRFELAIDETANKISGLSARGIAETFSTTPPLSLYGATKLSSEIMASEYGSFFSFPLWVNRCGTLAGPGQFGRVDQGILSYWIYNYLLEKPLKYIGYGGEGFQVRDFLHPDDLASLILKQMGQTSESSKPKIINIGGGLARSCSLAELTDWCNRRGKVKKTISSEPDNRLFDMPYYVTDTTLAAEVWKWRPETSLDDILESTWTWAEKNIEKIRLFA